jgi:hypothetical protein
MLANSAVVIRPSWLQRHERVWDADHQAVGRYVERLQDWHVPLDAQLNPSQSTYVWMSGNTWQPRRVTILELDTQLFQHRHTLGTDELCAPITKLFTLAVPRSAVASPFGNNTWLRSVSIAASAAQKSLRLVKEIMSAGREADALVPQTSCHRIWRGDESCRSRRIW